MTEAELARYWRGPNPSKRRRTFSSDGAATNEQRGAGSGDINMGPGHPLWLRRVAFHESGHAVAAVVNGLSLRYVTIIDDGENPAHCDIESYHERYGTPPLSEAVAQFFDSKLRRAKRRRLTPFTVTWLAGLAADTRNPYATTADLAAWADRVSRGVAWLIEHREIGSMAVRKRHAMFGDDTPPFIRDILETLSGSLNDWENALRHAQQAAREGLGLNRHLNAVWRHARTLVDKHLRSIESVTAALVERQHLNGAEVLAIVRESISPLQRSS